MKFMKITSTDVDNVIQHFKIVLTLNSNLTFEFATATVAFQLLMFFTAIRR